MAHLPYHEDNSVRKDIAFNIITAATEQYLEGAITETELAHKIVSTLEDSGVKWD